MKTKYLLWTLLLAGPCAMAQSPAPQSTTWFTVMGDPADPTVNTVQVDPTDADGNSRTMRVRVSRSTPRTSWDGVAYRSYTSNVFFDCEKNKATYLNLTFYALPNWRNEPFKTVDYTVGPSRFMEFRDVSPNPTQRILNAACRIVAKR